MARQGFHLEDFELVETISKGSFGTVYKAVRKGDGRVYALKQIKLKGMKRVDREEAIDEARVLSQLSHPHITQYHGSYIDKDEQLNILMEYAANGSLHARIRSAGGCKTLPEAKVWKYIIQALLGLGYIHSRKIIHRDIKSLNLFLDANDNIKIGDLGIARSLSGNSDFARTIVGTPYYLSPELCDDKPYNEKSDVWALGVVLYECCMGHYPFEAQNEGALIRKILKGTFSPISGPYSSALMQLAVAMLTFNPVRRPNVTQLLQNTAVVNQARTLGIDMSCKMPVQPDPPVYQKDAVSKPTPQQGQQPQQHSSDQAAAKAVAIAQPQQRQQLHRPSSAVRAAEPAANRGMEASRQHPFDLQQQQQQQQQHVGQQQAGRYPGDAAAISELQQMMAGAAVDAMQQRPQLLPAAGQARPSSAQASAPFAVAGGNIGRLHQTTSAQEAAAAIWTVKPTAPQFGRKRCTDLMATVPNLRGGAAGGARGYGAAPIADDATSYCTTSYQPTSHQ